MKPTTSEWFCSLDRSGRKTVLAALHSARTSLSKYPALHEPYCELLRHLEDEHEEVKARDRATGADGVARSFWERLTG